MAGLAERAGKIEKAAIGLLNSGAGVLLTGPVKNLLFELVTLVADLAREVEGRSDGK